MDANQSLARQGSKRSNRLLIVVALACMLAVWLGIVKGEPQKSGDLQFEIVSVKQNRSGTRSIGNRFSPGLVVWTNAPLQILITQAYHIAKYQLIGVPDWVASDRWDIQAKTASPHTMVEKTQMFQAFLAQRFALKVHWDTRNLAGYTLVVSKHGTKLQAATDEHAARPHISIARGAIRAFGMEISSLLDALSGELNMPVIDQTNLSGKYDFKLEWTPDELQPNSDSRSTPAELIGPSVFSAIQEQLGLKLEAHKEPAHVLLIDHVEKPESN